MFRYCLCRCTSSFLCRSSKLVPCNSCSTLPRSVTSCRSFPPRARDMSLKVEQVATLDHDQPTNSEVDLSDLPHSDLIARINNLQVQLQVQNAKVAALSAGNANSQHPATIRTRKQKKSPKPFDPNRYSTRHIALKFSYLGHRYNGYEHASGHFTPMPTIEEVLWKALRKARLISPQLADGVDDSFEVIYNEKKRYDVYFNSTSSHPDAKRSQLRLELNWDGCQYSKCGRTDRGVSAFGQVIGIRVRSNRPKVEETSVGTTEMLGIEEGSASTESSTPTAASPASTSSSKAKFDPIADELPYIAMLNTILPPDIRVLAWCPEPPEEFDARFSCEERRYKYLFTNPAFCPTPGRVGLENTKGQQSLIREGWLDIEKMKEAAKKLEGLHDYRNFCKIDASKQMPKCERRITFADIEEFNDNLADVVKRQDFNAHGDISLLNPALEMAGIEARRGPKLYTFSVHGSAFLWHQVRCMVAVLFLVGQGLERPEIVDEMLDIQKTPARPSYEMADDAPLILWDCIFPTPDSGIEDGLEWIYAGDAATLPSLTSTKGDGKFGLGGVVDELWKQWQEAKLKEAQLAGLLGLAIDQGDKSSWVRGGLRDPVSVTMRSQKVFDGGSRSRLAGDYQPLMQKPRLETLEEANARYLTGKGARRLERKAAMLNTDD